MTFPGFPGSFPRRPGRPAGSVVIPPRARRIALAVVILIVLAILFTVFGNIYTDLLWFRSVGYSKVFTTTLTAKIELFFAFGLAMAAVIGLNIVIAYRIRPEIRPLSPEQHSLERYRVAIAPYRWLVLTVLLILIGIGAGASGASRWRTWLTWRHGQSFGIKDPQFHKDLSYFTWTYPFQRWLLGFAFTATVLSIIAAAITHYLYGSLRVTTPGEKVTPAARAHLSSLLGVFVLLKAVAYFLDRYGLAFSSRGIVTGPSYTDVHAVLPAKTILTVLSVICAGLFFANIAYRRWLLPILAFGVMAVSAIVIGGVYPALVQQFSVKPNQADKEAPYIQRNINATQAAYGIVTKDNDHPDGNVAVTPYNATTKVSPGQLRRDTATLPGIRLLDPNIVAATFTQLQQFRGFYTFPDVLDIDRYTLTPGAGQTDAVVAARDVDLGALSGSQNNWINRHLVYTHGFGFVGATATRVDSDGKPVFFERDVPPVGALPKDFQPRIYFGEHSPSYSIVGAPAGKNDIELDYPTDQKASGQVNTTYQGDGGVSIGSFFRRVLYSMKFKEKNILLSGRINSDSRILYIRDPRDRVAKVAPYLHLDGDPYPAVIDGRIEWIVDGYTTSDGYPYSERTSLSSATRDTLTQTTASVQAQTSQVNYIRNSVKATVDAYDGTVHLYEWDSNDPVLKTWERIFPGTVQPKSEIPKDLEPHFRYPEDLFKIQRDLLTKYHVTNARAFYTGQDFWAVPGDPTTGGVAPQPPYYLTLAMPGDSTPHFSLTSTLVPRKRNNLAAFVAVGADPNGNYGQIRVLQLPRDTQVNGPEQVQNNFESFPKASTKLALLRRGGSTVELGNLLTLPVGDGLLYVEPVYVRAAGGTSYPLLKEVLTEFGNSIAFEPTLQAALDATFKGSAGVSVGPTGPPTKPGNGRTTGQLSAQIKQAIADANAAYADAIRAQRAGNYAAWGRAEARLKAALQRLAELSAQQSSPRASPSSSP